MTSTRDSTVESNGDLTDPKILEFLCTDSSIGTFHTVFCDGGMFVDGSEQNQEQSHGLLIFAEGVIGCATTKPSHLEGLGGTCNVTPSKSVLVCKIFDCNTARTHISLYLCSLFFHKYEFIKPVQSRPANAERYVIFTDRRPNTPQLEYILTWMKNQERLWWASADRDTFAFNLDSPIIRATGVSLIFSLLGQGEVQANPENGEVDNENEDENKEEKRREEKKSYGVDGVNPADFYLGSLRAQYESLQLQQAYVEAFFEVHSLFHRRPELRPYMRALQKKPYGRIGDEFTSLFNGQAANALCDVKLSTWGTQ